MPRDIGSRAKTEIQPLKKGVLTTGSDRQEDADDSAVAALDRIKN